MGVELMVLRVGEIKVSGLCTNYYDLMRTKLRPFGKIDSFRALDSLDFTVSPGEVVGIIGRNGSGKSTLLKTINGFLRPSEGYVETSGRVFLLAGVDPGLILGLTGRENSKLLAMAYGKNQDTLESFVNSVEEFCNLKGAFDRKVGGYSTGMRGKLGFGIITELEPDILLIDETLGVGDREFRTKAQARLRSFISRSGTVLISTHSLGLAKELCTRGILLENGRIEHDGSIGETIEKYVHITNN
tara:strand:+ start:5097 stop:5828 length:732 start_codon:yes stop_codon:yes gene_type:complete